MSDPGEPARPAPGRVGFFTMTPGRWVLLSAAGTAAVMFTGLVLNAWATREKFQEKLAAPADVPAPPPPARVIPPPGPDPTVVLREVGRGLDSAERHAESIRKAAGTSTHPAVVERAKEATASVERLVATCETGLKTLAGRPLPPEQAAERDRLTVRVAEVRRSLRAAAPAGATGRR